MIIIDPIFRIAITILDLYIWAIIISAILSWLVHFNEIRRPPDGSAPKPGG